MLEHTASENKSADSANCPKSKAMQTVSVVPPCVLSVKQSWKDDSYNLNILFSQELSETAKGLSQVSK